MKRMRWTIGLIVALAPIGWAGAVHAAAADSAGKATKGPSAALLMRLSRARQISSRPRTFQTQVGVAVAARRHGDAIEQQRRTLSILNNQYLLGTAAATPSESDIRQTIGILEQQMNAENPPENAYEIRYYLSACYEGLGDIPKATELLQGIVSEYGSSDDEIVKSFVEQAQADLARIGGAPGE